MKTLKDITVKQKKKLNKCTICGKLSAKKRTVKENGVLGYYDIEVMWCEKCTIRHNYYLLASWGGE